MASSQPEEAPILQSTAQWAAHVGELRQDLLSLTLVAVSAFVLAWSLVTLLQFGQIEAYQGPVLLLAVGAYVCHRLRLRSYHLACWTLMALANALMLWLLVTTRSHLPMLFGIPLIVVAQTLLGSIGSLSWVGIYVATGALAWRYGYGLIPPGFGNIAAVCCLAWVGAWLSSRPLQTSVSWALNGWQHANALLSETRTRRSELVRALKALEEATYRIERMNDELVLARKIAEEARAAKAHLVATVSHELRGPLNLILGFGKLIALSPESYGEPLPPAYRADVHTILRSTQHLVGLVDDILDLSQIEAERLPLVKDQVDLASDVIKKALDIVLPLASRKGLYLRSDVSASIPPLLADAVRLRQVVLNLLHNAVRHTVQGGISVQAVMNGDRVQVSVQDTGPGIPEEALPKLFREFQQVTAVGKAESEGSGLGLAISKHLIELHGGEIWVESALGEGTTFHFALPLPGRGEISAPVMTGSEAPMKRTRRKTCLVVHEDERAVRLLARHLENYQVVAVSDPGLILSMIADLHPRGVISPPRHAVEIETLMKDSTYKVPIILCDLYTGAPHQRFTGVIGHLIKPFVPDTIISLVRRVETGSEAPLLLVDDDPDSVRLLERILTSIPRGYRILRAYGGTQALELMQQTLPGLVFLDLIMPDKDGYQVLEEMRADSRLAQVPVVIVSGQDWDGGTSSIGTTIAVHHLVPLDLASRTRCLTAILDLVKPQYLPNA